MRQIFTEGRECHRRLTAGILAMLLVLATGCGNTPQTAPKAEDADAAQGQTPASEPADGAAAEAEKAPGETEQAPAETAEPVDPMTLYELYEETVTLMIYMTGSDLESGAAAATSDMAEIAQSGIDLGKVNLLIFTGGAPAWHSEDPVIPTDANVLYCLTENGYEEVERLDQLSMGDPANLERFLTYSFENYPADSYDLIFWNHGNGPVIGYGSDKQYGGDSLTLPELREGLEASPFGEDNKLSLIGFDACLMSSVELMCVCAPFADYLVASQETEPSFGWNYDYLAMAGRIRTEDLAREIVREYGAYCSEYFAQNEFFQSDVTLAAVDLSYAEELEKALDDLFAKAAADVSGKYNIIAKARVKTHGFGRASTGSEYDLVDLESLMVQLEEQYPGETQAVRDLAGKAVLVSEATVGESCGLSLFYPYYNKNYYKKSWKEDYAALGTLPEYASFLSRYEQVWLGTDLKELFEDELVLQQGKDEQTFTMQLTDAQAENYASARFYILRKEGEGIYALVFASGDVTEKKGVLTANFDGRILYYSNDFGEKAIPITRMYDTVDGVTNYSITAYVHNGMMLDESDESLMIDIQISVDQKTGELTVKGIYPNEGQEGITTGKREPIDLSYWHEFQFFNITGRYLTRDGEGRIKPYWEWPEGDWITWREMAVSNGIRFSYEPIYRDGYEYFIMFEVADVQDNRYSSELLPVMLAEAPEQENTKEAAEMTWESGNAFVFLDEQGTEAGFSLCTDADNGSALLEAFVNAGEEYPVHIDLDDLLINGNISMGQQSVYLWAEAGESYQNDLTSILQACRLAGISLPETISFTLTMTRSDTDAYLIYKRPCVIHISDSVEPQVQKLPILGAQAQSQLLTEEDGVRVELLEMGFMRSRNSYDPNLTVGYRITNDSPEQRKVILYGLSFNGVYLDKPVSAVLEPGDEWYTKQDFSETSIRRLSSRYLYAGRTDRLQSISSAAVVLKITDTVQTFPVTLSEAGEQGEIPAAGEVVYEDGRFRVLADSFRKEETDTEGEQRYVWELWFENVSGDYCAPYLYREGSGEYDYLSYSEVGPGGRVLTQVTLSSEEEIEELPVLIKTLIEGRRGFEASPVFVLKAE